jgi:hypothetical protein
MPKPITYDLAMRELEKATADKQAFIDAMKREVEKAKRGEPSTIRIRYPKRPQPHA